MIGAGLRGDSRRVGASRPQLKVCYLCGQQFGTASIGIHVPQCYAKKVAQWEAGNPATRGSKPKHPDTVDWKGSKGQSAKKLNDEQFSEFQANLVPCPICARTFLPDRLPVHLRGCKGGEAAPRAPSRPTTRSGGPPAGAALRGPLGKRAASQGGDNAHSSTRSTSTSPSRRVPGERLILPTCYLCGQQFGTASIGIHVPQCYVKKLAQWEAGNPATRGTAPRHPDDVMWRPNQRNGGAADGSGSGGGDGSMTLKEQSDAQFQEFVNSLEPCPNCGRKFLSDRLIVHLRSCRPGHAAKRVGTGLRATEVAPEKPALAGPSSSSSPPTGPTESLPEELDRVHPMRNRVPKNSSVKAGSGRTCPQCDAVEHDSCAKYCRECGWNLNSHALSEPCGRCGEAVPEGARFCSTCGEPVNGAAASEREAGGENINAPTVRMTTCPACKAVCDADGNFCDNCGAVLGSAEPAAAEAEAHGGSVTAEPSESRERYMYCEECDEPVTDLDAVYCEDCGGKLQLMEREARGASGGEERTGHAVGTLRPESKPEHLSAPPPPKPPSGSSQVSSRKQLQQTLVAPVSSASAARDSEGFDAYDAGDDAAAVDLERVECASCGRRFAPDALQRHANVCGRQGKQRPVFNMTKQRLADCDVPATRTSSPAGRGRGTARAAAAAARSGVSAAEGKPKGKDWRRESRAFREAMRNARQVSAAMRSGGDPRDLPPPTYSENAHYVPCPHCQRRFAPDVAERHIPKCATTVNRPKPPPRGR